ncbi:MAG: DUF3788 family protein [Oscillospiraceae bacterium]|nr:DUF3788 family protein [Oscillospiraceae bacterium]
MKITQLQKVSQETMRFMRGKYLADEIGENSNTLRFRRGGKTILTIYIRADHYVFLLIFGKAEREKFEQIRHEFAPKIIQFYDNSTTHHDGKWVHIPVSDLETLEMVKPLIIFKKKPNRKPFPKDKAVYAYCGHRCDLCIHYTGETWVSPEIIEDAKQRIKSLYGQVDDEPVPPCKGCNHGGISGLHDCVQMKCARAQKLSKCSDCKKHNTHTCAKQTVGIPPEIHTGIIAADDVTWGILPYVPGQYGN